MNNDVKKSYYLIIVRICSSCFGHSMRQMLKDLASFALKPGVTFFVINGYHAISEVDSFGISEASSAL